MPLNPINLGTTANDGTGSTLREAMDRSNKNDAYLEGLISSGSGGVVSGFSAAKNLLINGDFFVWQRGKSFSNDSNIYTADRWRSSTGNNIRHTVKNVGLRGLKIESSENKRDSYIGIRQTIPNYYELNGKAITLSGWVKTNVAGKVALRIQRVSSTDYHPGNGAWKKMFYTVTRSDFGDYIDFGVSMFPGAASDIDRRDYIEVKEFQLEMGTQASEFEVINPITELMQCRHFYRILGGNVAIFDAVLYEAHVPVDWIDMYKVPTPKLLKGSGTLINLGRVTYNILGIKLNESRGLIDLITITPGAEDGIALALLPGAVALDSEIYES